MTATNHALTGAAIAMVVRQPALALPLALVAHFVMDIIPHSDLNIKEITADVLFGVLLIISLALFLSGTFSVWLMLACAFLCASPDLVWGWRYYKLRDKDKIILEPMSSFSRWHQKIQWSESRPGIYVEVVWFVATVWIILAFRN